MAWLDMKPHSLGGRLHRCGCGGMRWRHGHARHRLYRHRRGTAGATATAHLSADHKAALTKAEQAAGYHTSGRSAAPWVANGGPEHERTLAQEFLGFPTNPPPGFASTPKLAEWPVAFAVPEEQLTDLHASHHRRLARDFERHVRCAAAFVRLAMIQIMMRRLARCSG